MNFPRKNNTKQFESSSIHVTKSVEKNRTREPSFGIVSVTSRDGAPRERRGKSSLELCEILVRELAGSPIDDFALAAALALSLAFSFAAALAQPALRVRWPPPLRRS